MLIKKGAEAALYLENWHSRKAILKRRLSKAYRITEIDEKIRSQRTAHEPQIIHKAKKAGVPTPTIYMIDLPDATIFMEFIEGKQIKQILGTLSIKERHDLCQHVGILIARLHAYGIVHGDLTTSNMILTPNGKVVFLDFGLSEHSTELETRGVDLHLMKRAFQSSHFQYANECFAAVMEGYTAFLGEEGANNVLKKIREIERRGRYISER